MTAKALAASLSLLALAACNQADFVPQASFQGAGYDRTTTSGIRAAVRAPDRAYTLAHTIAPAQAMVFLPADAGRVLHVSEATGDGARRQVTTYAATNDVAGENKLTVMIDRSSRAPSRTAMQRAWNQAMPGVAMRYTGGESANAYGAFSYASGRYGKTRCIFGWQQVSARPAQGRLTMPFSRNPATMRMRVRLCHANVSERQLVSMMERLSIQADPETALKATSLRWQGAQPAPAAYVAPRPVYEVVERPVGTPRKIVRQRAKPKRPVSKAQLPVRTAGTPFVPSPKDTTTVVENMKPVSTVQAFVPPPSTMPVATEHAAALASADQ